MSLKPSNKTIGVLGAGSFGTALTILLAKKQQEVLLFVRDPKKLESLKSTFENIFYLPGIPIPTSVRFTNSIEQLLTLSKTILIATPSQAFLDITHELLRYWQSHHSLISVTKGLTPNTGKFFHETILQNFGEAVPFSVLSGPSFAREVALGSPTAVTVASSHKSFLAETQTLFHEDTFRVYTTDDVLGVEFGGVVKNILGVAAGISDGLNLGANARAALITRGLAEMMRMGEALGARRETLMGLSGCGDVILTCTDNQSRNRRFGTALAQGLTKHEALNKIGQSVEAVHNVAHLYSLAKTKGVSMPITEQVFRVLSQEVTVSEAVMALFKRAPKDE